MSYNDAPEKKDEISQTGGGGGDPFSREILIVGSDSSDTQVLLFLENVSGE